MQIWLGIWADFFSLKLPACIFLRFWPPPSTEWSLITGLHNSDLRDSMHNIWAYGEILTFFDTLESVKIRYAHNNCKWQNVLWSMLPMYRASISVSGNIKIVLICALYQLRYFLTNFNNLTITFFGGILYVKRGDPGSKWCRQRAAGWRSHFCGGPGVTTSSIRQ